MHSSQFVRGTLLGLIVILFGVTGCSSPGDDSGDGGQAADRGSEAADTAPQQTAPARVATAKPEDVEAAKSLVDAMGGAATYTVLPGNVMTQISIQDGSTLSAENIALFGRLTDLETLEIKNFRSLNDEMVAQLVGLANLTTLALTNSVIGDSTVETIVTSFPNLTVLDLSSNTNMTNSVLKVICNLSKLERLILVQNRFNDLATIHLSKLTNLRVLDLRGNMGAGDMTMDVVGKLPKLVALKHRTTTVTDAGVESLAQSKTLRSLLMQDFGVTSEAGQYLAQLNALTELEVFRCQGFGSEGVLALKGMKLQRLKLRDLPMVDDFGMEVLADLPDLKRLELHELGSTSDMGLKNLESLTSLEVLDIWSVPQMSDATVEVITALPNVKTLSIRETSVTDEAVDMLLGMSSLQSLTFKDNGLVTDEGLKKLSTKKWAKLDVGQ